MRQQEANQFDKGMSLDTNAIAMDNHTLSGALNATMITMNGNELVLQNDMGNAKVESAYLPTGFVPVGMQEFGGIVYVASYNPFTKESQIGSFPSPERNIAGQEEGTEANIADIFVGGNITKLSSRALLLKGPIRAGDQFKITTTTNNGSLAEAIRQDLATFKVLVLDADGSGIDITKDMKGYSDANPLGFIGNDFTTYKSKIAGSVWLQESLVIPAYISVSITSTANVSSGGEGEDPSETATLTFTAHAYDSDGNPWETSHTENASHLIKYKYEVDGNSIGEGVSGTISNVPLGHETILSYSVTPVYRYGNSDAYITALTQTGSVAVDLLGSGKIEIPLLRYYNDVINNQLTLDYVINAYVENSEHSVTSVYLEAYDYAYCSVNGSSITAGSQIKIPLSASNIFGSYSAIIPYAQSVEDGGKLLKGHMYIARLVAVRSTPGPVSESTGEPTITTADYTSKWIVLLTSAITNDLYMNSSSAGMLEGDSEEAVVIPVDWDINWEEKELGHAYNDVLIPELNTGTPIPTELEEGELIKLQTTRNGDFIKKYKAEVEVDTIDDNFPFDIETTLELSIPTETVTEGSGEVGSGETENLGSESESTGYSTYTTDIEYSGGRNKEGMLASEQNIPLGTTDSEDITINSAWSNTGSGEGSDVIFNEDGTLERTIHYRLHSQFVAEPSDLLNFVGNDMPALVQYQTTMPADEDTIRDMVGSDVFDALSGSSSGTYQELKPQTWWSWGTRKGRKKNTRERLMGLMAAEADYTLCSQVVKEIPEMESLTDTGYGIFNTSTTNTSWRYYSTVTMDYIHNSLKLYPYLFFWQGANDDSTTFRIGNIATKDYTIPIMLDASGEMYLIGQYRYGSGHGNMLLDIIRCFNNIYVYQQGQTVEYNYYKASNELAKYAYTNTYQMKIECTYKATPTIVFKCGDTVYTGGAVSFTVNDTTYPIRLPEFVQAETSKSGTDLKQFTTYVYSPDQLAKNLEYLDAEPSLGNVAVVKNNDGTTSIVSTGRKVENGEDIGSEPLDVSHIYFGIANGKNTKLYDCTKSLPNTIDGTALNNGTPGKLIADAIKNRYLRVIFSSENDRNIIIINKSAVTNKAARTCNVSIGDDKMKTELSGIASKHLLAVPLFTGTGIQNMTITTY